MVTVIALVILGIAVVTGILALLIAWKRKKEGIPQVDYRSFFVIEHSGGLLAGRVRHI